MPYLAMTAAEFRACHPLPEKTAWMACHFSPYGTGLTNLPEALPPGSLLILNDRTPIHGHDPALVRDTLAELTEKFQCAGVLLDFQRTVCRESPRLVEAVLTLPCPVCVTAEHQVGTHHPIFLSPVPPLQTAEEYLSPWQGREVWLEAALDGITVTLTDRGSTTAPLPPGEKPECPHFDAELLCHYRLDLHRDRAVFTLRRTREDLTALLESCRSWGITRSVGLWQELGPNTFPTDSLFNRCGSTLGFPRGEAVAEIGSSQPISVTDEECGR